MGLNGLCFLRTGQRQSSKFLPAYEKHSVVCYCKTQYELDAQEPDTKSSKHHCWEFPICAPSLAKLFLNVNTPLFIDQFGWKLVCIYLHD